MQKIKHNVNFKTLTSGKIKMNIMDEEDYRAIIKILKAIKAQENHPLKKVTYHTFQCKQLKPYKIVIRGLHSTTNEAEIKNELARLGHEAIRVTNVIIKKKINEMSTKIVIPLFYDDLVTKPNNKDVYELEHVILLNQS